MEQTESSTGDLPDRYALIHSHDVLVVLEKIDDIRDCRRNPAPPLVEELVKSLRRKRQRVGSSAVLYPAGLTMASVFEEIKEINTAFRQISNPTCIPSAEEACTAIYPRLGHTGYSRAVVPTWTRTLINHK